MTIKLELSKTEIELIKYWYDYLLTGTSNPKTDPYLDILNKLKSAAKLAENEVKTQTDYVLGWKEEGVCVCSHNANKHAGNGVCVSDSCNCFDFKLKE